MVLQKTALPPTADSPVETPSTTRRTVVILASVGVGLAIAVLWSARLVDAEIGETVADGILGRDARAGAVGTGLAGAVFAFVAGLAGTFTACNIAAFSAVGPLMGRGDTALSRTRQALPQLGWLSLGVVAIAGVYGAIGAAIGTRIPQLSTQTIGHNMPVRVVQSSIVFTVLGLVFVWLGLAAIRVVPDPLAPLTRRWPNSQMVVMGVLIGAFLIGRPYPLFFKLFQQAAATHNPLFGAATFILTALGNILVMAVVFLALVIGSRGRFGRWLTARPGRLATLTATALIIGGAFMVFYWGVRLPARFDYLWFPRMPWQ
jgi:hypothetical protein